MRYKGYSSCNEEGKVNFSRIYSHVCHVSFPLPRWSRMYVNTPCSSWYTPPLPLYTDVIHSPRQTDHAECATHCSKLNPQPQFHLLGPFGQGKYYRGLITHNEKVKKKDCTFIVIFLKM